jgi:D-hydroxyproline dehydrogenase
MQTKPHIAVVGAGIVGICSAYFLNKSGFQVTLIDQNDPASMTSYGHACTFADYACVPINSTNLFKDVPSMLMRSDGPLSIDFFYMIKNLDWALKFLRNSSKKNVNKISEALGNILKSASVSYDEIFSDIEVSQFIKNEEAIYLYKNELAYLKEKRANDIRKKNGVEIKILSQSDVLDLEPNLAPVFHNGQLFIGSRHTTNPSAISKKIFESFINNGGIFIKQSIENIIPNESLVSLNYNNNNYNFDKVVICAGSWSNNLTKKFGENFPLDTERGYHVMFDNHDLINRPVGWSHSGFYLVQLQEGLRAAGTVEIAGLLKPKNEKRTKMIEAQARKLLPQLNDVKSTWLGFRPTLPDSLPVIGKSQKHKNIIFGFGHQHIGWTLGAVTGKIINTLCDDRQPNINIEPFSPNRFN